MDTSSLLIGLGVTQLFNIPIYLYTRNKKKKENMALEQFVATGLKYGIEITELDSWQNSIIGIDSLKKKILFLRTVNDYEDETLVDLNQVKKCELIKVERNLEDGNSTVARINLVFHLGNNKPDYSLEFYNSENTMMIVSELQMAEKWCNIAIELI